MANRVIYLDNASTTSVNPDVLKSYEEVAINHNGNASSIHQVGLDASLLLEKGRKQILSLLGLNNTHELIFLSGATESNNLAIKGIAFNYMNRGKHLITTCIEHPSVLSAFKQLEEKFGFEVTYLPVYEDGKIKVEDLKNAIRKDTILVSIMAANNETGAVQPIKEVGDLLKDYPKIYFHSDIVQAIGKVDVPFDKIDLITFTSHKIHGLKGCGCLIKEKSISLMPLNSGGAQEDGYRSGTVDVAGAIAFAKALRLTLEKQKEATYHIKNLSNRLVEYIKNNQDLYRLNSNIEDNPYIVNFSILNKKAAVIVEGLSRNSIMVSSISACNSKHESISYVINAMYHDENLAHNTIRVSPSYENNMEDIELLIDVLDILVKGIR